MNLSKLHSLLLLAAAVMASTLVVRLGLQKRALERRVEELLTRTRDPYPGFLVPPVSVESVQGDSIVLGGAAPGTLQLMFVFSTTCGSCVASMPAVKSIHAELGTNAPIELFGVSVDSLEATRRYMEEHGLAFPVVSLTLRRLLALYRLRRVPQLLLLDHLGRVQYVRAGALAEAHAIDSVRATILATLAATQLSSGGQDTLEDTRGVGASNRR